MEILIITMRHEIYDLTIEEGFTVESLTPSLEDFYRPRYSLG